MSAYDRAAWVYFGGAGSGLITGVVMRAVDTILGGGLVNVDVLAGGLGVVLAAAAAYGLHQGDSQEVPA